MYSVLNVYIDGLCRHSLVLKLLNSYRLSKNPELIAETDSAKMSISKTFTSLARSAHHTEH